MEFRLEHAEDSAEIEFLFDLCFAPGRRALSSYRLREGVRPIAEISLICRDEAGVLIGAIRYWPVLAGGAPSLLLGPIAVHPIAQGAGIAATLIRHSLNLAREAGWERVILIGDAPYYSRFGFSREPVRSLSFPQPVNEERFLGCELAPGAFEGLGGEVTHFKSEAD